MTKASQPATPLGIIRFIEEVIGDRSLSPAQKVILKSIYGEPMTAAEEMIFCGLSGLERYRQREWEEVTLVAGRGSGKSNQICSNLAIFEAVGRRHQLAVGERGVIAVISTEQRRQSKIVFSYIERKMQRSKVLRAMIEGTTSDEVRLRNGMIIQVMPCNLARVRGPSYQLVIADELAFWKSEGRSIDREVLEAVRPGLRLPHSKLVKISSPYAMRGELFLDWKGFYGKENDDLLCLRASTKLLNPSFSDRKLEAARRRDPVSFATEYEAQFRTDVAGLLDPAVIERAVAPDRPLELPYRHKLAPYYAFVDVAGGGGQDSFAVAIGHLEGERIVIDLVRSRPPKFNPEAVVEETCDLVRSYNIHEVEGDKFSGDMAMNLFAKHKVDYRPAGKSKSELYLEAEGIFNAGRIEIPNRQALIGQLQALVRKTRTGGRDSVDTDTGSPEDEANVACGLAVRLALDAVAGGQAGFELLPDVYPREEEPQGMSFGEFYSRARERGNESGTSPYNNYGDWLARSAPDPMKFRRKR